MSKNKFYVVWKGRNPGVYDKWEKCKKEIENFAGALYQGFPDKAIAESAFAQGFSGFKKKNAPKIDLSKSIEKPVSQSIAVDAACSGNPGKMEYQGVFVDFNTQPTTTKQLFKSPIFPNATNNIGEFLAIVHALSLQKKNGWNLPIYSDSVNAQLWVKQKKCRTKLERNAKTEELFQLIERAEKWLRENTYNIPIIKWDKNVWGETPADFGRK